MNSSNNCNINLFPALVNTKKGSFYGYINSNGEFIIKPKFTMAMDFNNAGLAIACTGDFCGLIDSSGEYVVKPVYSFINPFVEDRAIFTKGNVMGVLDDKGNVVTTKPYNFISDYSDSLATIGISRDSGNYLYGYIDKDGSEVIHPTFQESGSFKEGYALVQTTYGVYEIIDKTGKVRTTFPYKYVGNLGDNLLTFSEEPGGLMGYVDIDGNIILKPQFTTALPAEDGYLIVSTSSNYIGKYGVIDINNHVIYPYIYNDIKYLGDNRFALGIPRNEESLFMNNLYAIGTGNGAILTGFKFKNIERYTHGITSASDLKNTFFIDSNGRQINDLPIIEGTGTLSIKCNLIFADVDYWPSYLTMCGKIIYEPNAKIPLDDKYSVLKVKYKPNVTYLIYYPQVRGVSPYNIEILINSKLRDLSDLEKINEDDVLDYDRYGNFNVLFFEKDLFIPDINIYNYPFGAAHGLTSRKTPNINLKTGEFYKLSDLFKGSIYWTHYIDEIIKTMIKTDPQYEYVYPDGFKGISQNQDFYVDKENLYIYFTPYDIAPYSAGFVTFKIPFKDIDSLINKNGFFYNSFN